MCGFVRTNLRGSIKVYTGYAPVSLEVSCLLYLRILTLQCDTCIMRLM